MKPMNPKTETVIAIKRVGLMSLRVKPVTALEVFVVLIAVIVVKR